MASVRLRHGGPRHRAQQPQRIKVRGRKQTRPDTKTAPTSNFKPGLKVGRHSGRRLAIPLLAIKAHMGRAHMAQRGRVISAHEPLLQATSATGSISTKAFPFRSRSGCCATTPVSIGFQLPTSSGCCSNCIQ